MDKGHRDYQRHFPCSLSRWENSVRLEVGHMSIIELVYESLTQRLCSELFAEGIDIIRDVSGNSFEIVMDYGR